MKNSKIIIALLVSFCASNALAQSSSSGTYDRFNDSFSVHLGAFVPKMDSEITISGDVVTPPPIDIEDVLGVNDGEAVPWLGISWQISQRNSVEFEYFKLERDGFINLIPDPIEVGDLIIESGSVNTAFDIGVGRLTYGFSLMRSERSNFKLKGGLHIADMSVGVQLSGAVCDVSMGEMPPCPGGQTPPAESGDVTAPLPHFGASWDYAFTPTLHGEIRAMGFAIELDGIDGSLLELSGDLIWQPWRNIGFGVGIRSFNVNVKADDSDLSGEFDLSYIGPTISVMASF